MEFTYLSNNQIEHKDIVNKNFGIITTISGSISGNYRQGFYSSMYTTKDDIIDSIVFDSMELPRLVDLERELYFYENKHKMKSEDFYRKWKVISSFDNLEFNEWAKIYKFLEYVKEH